MVSPQAGLSGADAEAAGEPTATAALRAGPECAAPGTRLDDGHVDLLSAQTSACQPILRGARLEINRRDMPESGGAGKP